MADREKCQSLVDPDHPVFIDKVPCPISSSFIKFGTHLIISYFQEEDCGTYRLIHGHFASPLAAHLPGVVPKESETAFFQFVVPKKWTWPDGMKPVVVHLAGTGDHVSLPHSSIAARTDSSNDCFHVSISGGAAC